MLCEREEEVLKAIKGAVVILPAVTYANVGELAVDILVASLRPESLGQLESPNVLPVVGNDAYDTPSALAKAQPGKLCTALELFSLPDRPLVLLQQRAPAMLGHQGAYAAELVGWLRCVGVAAVVVLTGLDAQLRRDRQLDSGQLRYLASSDDLRTACEATAQPASLERPLPSLDVPQPPLEGPLLELEPEVREEEQQLHHSLPPWPLVQQCTVQGMPYVLLGCFAAEGDNAGEGLRLAGAALGVLRGMRVPTSEGSGSAGEGSAGSGADGGGGAEDGAGSGSGCRAVLGEETWGWNLQAPASWVGLYGRSFPQEIF